MRGSELLVTHTMQGIYIGNADMVKAEVEDTVLLYNTFCVNLSIRSNLKIVCRHFVHVIWFVRYKM